MALTDTAVRQAEPSGKNYTLKDADGLALSVGPKGAKHWHFQFYWLGKQARISLGGYLAVSLKDARKARDQARTVPLPLPGRCSQTSSVSDDPAISPATDTPHDHLHPSDNAVRSGQSTPSRDNLNYLDQEALAVGLLKFASILGIGEGHLFHRGSTAKFVPG